MEWSVRWRPEPQKLFPESCGFELQTHQSLMCLLAPTPTGLSRSPAANQAWRPHLTAPPCSSSRRSFLFLCLWLFPALKAGSNIFLCHDKIQSFKVSSCNCGKHQGSQLWQRALLAGEPESWFLLTPGCDLHTSAQLPKVLLWQQGRPWTSPSSKSGSYNHFSHTILRSSRSL